MMAADIFLAVFANDRNNYNYRSNSYYNLFINTITYPKRGKMGIGIEVRKLTLNKFLPQCQMLGSGVQVNLIYMPCLLISSRPISSNFLIDSSYPKYKQSYFVLNTSGQGNGGIHSPATLEQIIKLNNIFIDNPI